MKTESVRKVMIVVSVLLIGVAICVSVWFFLSEQKTTEVQEQNASPPKITSKDVNNETAKIAPLTREPVIGARGSVIGERVARQSRKMFRSLLSEEQLANPHFQKMLEVMDSPEYAELPMPPSLRQWNDFLESKGIPVTRGRPGVFTKQPPFISLDDYEPIIRQGIAELFLAQEPVDMTDPEAALSLRVKIFSNLDNVVANGRRWFWERFGEDWDGIFRVEGMEDNPAVIWMNDIQHNAASIVAAAEQAGVDALEASAPSWDMSAIMESPSVSSDATTEENPSISRPAIDALELSVISKPETDAAATPAPGLTDVSQAPADLPTVEGLEAALKSQFSKERFDRAMSTLEQYGPEEGLRRLRENDPEVAKQIEKARYHNRQEAAQ